MNDGDSLPTYKEVIGRMEIKEGDKFKHNFTGKVYKVKKIQGKMVILEAQTENSQILTEQSSLKLFYKSEGNRGKG